MSDAAICANGAKSPEAPTEPWSGITGYIPLLSKSSIKTMVFQDTPDAPRPKERSFNAIINRVVPKSKAFPTPQQ